MHRLSHWLLLAGLLMSAAAAAGAPPPESTPAAKAAVAASFGGILRGGSAEALQALTAVPEDAFVGEARAYRACMLDRFQRSEPPPPAATVEDPFVRSVLTAYQAYWWRALASPPRRAELEARLQEDLRALLGEHAAGATDFASIETELKRQIEQHGYHALTGLTPPLRELMLWRTQTPREYDVVLPDGPQRVHVELLDDFASLGWSAYGLCGHGSNGGWATASALFAVVPSYKNGLDGDDFRVVFLDHEAQHFADKKRFTGLKDWELEYRAKLVELAEAGAPLSGKQLKSFIASQGSDPAAPHPYANKQLIAALSQRLGAPPDQVPLARLQEAARDELRADTRRRRAERGDHD